jgi:hypothetical protein
VHRFYGAYNRVIINSPNVHRTRGIDWALFADGRTEQRLQGKSGGSALAFLSTAGCILGLFASISKAISEAD